MLTKGHSARQIKKCASAGRVRYFSSLDMTEARRGQNKKRRCNMLEALITAEFWIALAIVAVLIIGREALKGYLKRKVKSCQKREDKK